MLTSRLARSEERFRAVVEGLGTNRVEAQIGAAVTPRSFVRAGAELFYRQVFDLAAAHLRLPVPPGRAPEAAFALTSALATVLVESFPLARGELAVEHRQPLDWASARPVWRTFGHLDARNVAAPGVTMLAADLRYATLGEANFQSSNLSRSDLSGAQLVGVNFSRALLRDAKLTGAQCIAAKFADVDLERADLSGAHLEDANPEEARNLKDTIMRRVTGLTPNLRAARQANGAILDDDGASDAARGAAPDRRP